jgi:hypothetical protein
MNYFTDGGIRDGAFREGSVGFKVNYRLERSERTRLKRNRKDAKLHALEKATARRKLEAQQRFAVIPEAPDDDRCPANAAISPARL